MIELPQIAVGEITRQQSQSDATAASIQPVHIQGSEPCVHCRRGRDKAVVSDPATKQDGEGVLQQPGSALGC